MTSAFRAGVFNAALRAGGRVWEPCAGRGVISRTLRGFGLDVVAQDLVAYDGADPDIATPIDFLMEQRAPEGVGCIITNPPYKLADDFIRHGLRLAPEVVVFLRLMALEGAGRSDIIDRHLRAVYAGIERAPAMHREGWEGRKITNSGAPFAWFHFSRATRVGAAIALHRISWRRAA